MSAHRKPPFSLPQSLQVTNLPVIAGSLRFPMHRIARRSLAASDYFPIASTTAAFGCHAVCIVLVVQRGVGWGHALELETTYGLAPMGKILKPVLVLGMFWAMSMSLSEASILPFDVSCSKKTCTWRICHEGLLLLWFSGRFRGS